LDNEDILIKEENEKIKNVDDLIKLGNKINIQHQNNKGEEKEKNEEIKNKKKRGKRYI